MFTLQQTAQDEAAQYVHLQNAHGSAPNNWKWISGLKIAQKVVESERRRFKADKC